MGAEVSTSQIDFHDFQKKFLFQKQFFSENFGDIKLMKHPVDDFYVAIKTYLQQGVVDPKALEQSAEEQSKMMHESLARCIHCFRNNHEELCSRFIKTHLVYEYFPRTLVHEIEKRHRDHEFFVEAEIIALIFSVISGLVYLKNLRKCHGEINPEHVMITKEGKFKISDVQFLTELDEYKRFLAGMAAGKNCYLSPRLFQSLGHRILNPVHSIEKSEVFSLGMIIVHMGLLEFPTDLYNFDAFEINEPQLKNLLSKKALGLYSDKLQVLLYKMLEFDEDLRLDYEQVMQELEFILNPLFPSNLGILVKSKLSPNVESPEKRFPTELGPLSGDRPLAISEILLQKGMTFEVEREEKIKRVGLNLEKKPIALPRKIPENVKSPEKRFPTELGPPSGDRPLGISEILLQKGMTFEVEREEKIKRAGLNLEKKPSVFQRGSPAPVLERETMFDEEEEVELRIPNNIHLVFDKMFRSDIH